MLSPSNTCQSVLHTAGLPSDLFEICIRSSLPTSPSYFTLTTKTIFVYPFVLQIKTNILKSQQGIKLKAFSALSHTIFTPVSFILRTLALVFTMSLHEPFLLNRSLITTFLWGSCSFCKPHLKSPT